MLGIVSGWRRKGKTYLVEAAPMVEITPFADTASLLPAAQRQCWQQQASN
jgi:hypothetical protein